MVRSGHVAFVLASLALLVATSAGAAPDLEVEAIDASALASDCGSRLTTGSLLVSVRNGIQPMATKRLGY